MFGLTKKEAPAPLPVSRTMEADLEWLATLVPDVTVSLYPGLRWRAYCKAQPVPGTEVRIESMHGFDHPADAVAQLAERVAQVMGRKPTTPTDGEKP